MPIDRPDPSDAYDAPDGPAIPETPRQRSAPPPRPDAAARDAYRAHVERSYAAHRDRTTWDEAVPQLRAAWAEHQRQYPERGRATRARTPITPGPRAKRAG